MSDFVWGFFEYCGDVQPAEGDIEGYMCTLPRGHDGWHEAAGNDWLETWPPKDEGEIHDSHMASATQQGGSHYCKPDGGKLRYDLIPPAALERVVSVLTKGAEKHNEGYGEINWRRGAEYTRLYAAVQRHLKDWYKGEEIDADTDEPHLACAISDLLMLLDIQQSGAGKDDRPFK